MKILNLDCYSICDSMFYFIWLEVLFDQREIIVLSAKYVFLQKQLEVLLLIRNNILINDKQNILQLRVVGLIGKFITGPWMRSL